MNKLPEDIIVEIIKLLNMSDIENICSASLYIHKICNRIKNIIISKLPKDSLMVNDFTLQQLFVYNKIIPLKRKIIVAHDDVYVNLDERLYIIENGTVKLLFTSIGSNQIIPSIYRKMIISNDNGKVFCRNSPYRKMMILNNDGKVFCHDLITEEVNLFNSNVNNITQYNDDIVKISSTNGNYHNYKLVQNDHKLYTTVSLDKNLASEIIIQQFGNFKLTSKGEVYEQYSIKIDDEHIINNYKICGLPKIVQMTEHKFMLAANGNVYRHVNNSFNIIWIKNIKQICSVIDGIKKIAYLNNNGEVYAGNFDKTPEKIYELSDIIEIAFKKHNLVALDANLKLHIYSLYVYNANRHVEVHDINKLKF